MGALRLERAGLKTAQLPLTLTKSEARIYRFTMTSAEFKRWLEKLGVK